MNTNTKQYIIIGTVVVLLIAIAIYVMTGTGKNSQEAEDKDTVFKKPTNVIPTVDSTVMVEIEGDKDAVITIKGVPEGTEDIEFELSYPTKNGSVEGVFGSIEVDGEDMVEKEVTFGTESSGVKRYHEIDGDVSGIFKFSGEYGQKMLEKEFSL